KNSGFCSASTWAAAISFSWPASVLVGKNSKLTGMLLLFISCLLANAGGGALAPPPRRVSVAVGVRLERTFHRHADVVGLLLGQTGDHATEALDHFQRHFLVQLLGQHFHAQQLLAGGGVEV